MKKEDAGKRSHRLWAIHTLQYVSRILLLTVCKRIEPGLPPEIKGEKPLNLKDDETKYKFSYAKSIKNLYEPNHPPPITISARAPWEKITQKKKAPTQRKIKFAFQKPEDEISFRNRASNKSTSVDEASSSENDSSDHIIMPGDVELTSENSE